MSELVRARLLVSGRVQGVFYRATTRDKAIGLGLTGWVCNLPDGRVEAVAEGSRQEVESLIEWARQGPRLARVNCVEVAWEEALGEATSFQVRY